jgi:peptidoglycan L-alanyl-D-glutamate endopeptidase CwlK
VAGYGWGAASLANLGTCDPLLIALFTRAIKRADLRRDMRVVYGHRTNAQQAELYAKGRTTPGPIVTWSKPGTSRHNTTPSQAIDVVPLFGGKVSYQWPDYHAIAPSIKAEWADMKAEGLVPAGVTLEWGGDWRKPDGAHWQINGVR